MRKYLMFLLVLISFHANAQEWLLGVKKPISELTFAEELKLFEEYCKQNNFDNGKILRNGKMVKLHGAKQFLRRKQMWEHNLDPNTGGYPDYRKHLVKKSLFDNSDSDWWEVGPIAAEDHFGNGRVNVIAFHPTNPDVIFLGAPTGGIWKTTTGGNNWTPLSDQMPSIGVSEIIVSRNFDEDQTIYIGTGDRDDPSHPSIGVWKSTDRGESWQPTALEYNPSEDVYINRMLLHPTNNSKIYAATSEGLYLTEDKGETWQYLCSYRFNDLEFNPNNPDIIIGGTRNWGTLRILKSEDGGKSWSTQLKEKGCRISLAVTADQPNYVYAIIANIYGGLNGIFKSIDSGDSWEKIIDGDEPGNEYLAWYDGNQGNVGQGFFDLTICANPQNADEVYLGGRLTFKSEDGGHNWKFVNDWNVPGQYTYPDKHDQIFHPITNELFEANDGGIYKTIDASTWTKLTETLGISQMYRLGISQSSSNECITGHQDNGSKLEINNVWDKVLGADGMECIIHPTNSNIQYASKQYGQIYYTEDKWETEPKMISPNLPSNSDWVTPYVISPIDPNRIFIGAKKLYTTNNIDQGWDVINDIGGAKINAIGLSDNDINTLVIARKKKLYRTTNMGASWEDISDGLPVNNYYIITNITIAHKNTNRMWVTFSGYNNNSVYETNDAGKTWVNISDGLPEIPINCIVQNKSNLNTTELYLATEFGVYRKLGDEKWKSFNNYLPNVLVSEIEIHYGDIENTLYAATYGRGLWATPLAQAPENILETNLSKENVWPNPCKNAAYIKPKQSDEIIRVMSSDGKIVYETIAHSNLIKLNTSGWKDGIYFVKQVNKGNTSVSKLVVTH